MTAALTTLIQELDAYRQTSGVQPLMAAVDHFVSVLNEFAAGSGTTLAGDASGPASANQVTVTHLSAALPVAQGGTGNTTGAPAGAATGDLSGNYPAPTVAKINGSAPAAIATSGSATDLIAGTVPSARLQAAASSQLSIAGAIAAPTSTASFTMAGLAGGITPTKSGNVLVIISGTIITGLANAGDGIVYQISHGTGAAPGANAALTGTQDGQNQQAEIAIASTAADVFIPFSIQFLITGLVLNTAVWLDLAQKGITVANQVKFNNVSISAIEL